MSAAGQPGPWHAAMEVVTATGAEVSSDQTFQRVLLHAEALHQRLVSLQSRVRLVVAALDHVPVAMFLVTHQAHVIAENAVATRLTTARDGLSLVDDVLRLSRPQDTQNLRDAFVLTHGSRGRVGIQFSRPSGLMPYLGVVARLDSGLGESDASCYLLGVSDPASDPKVDEQLLRSLYGLTRAESRVATLLLRGRTPDQAADELCVTIATVRTHIKRLLLKTDTDRQGRLIGVLLAGPGYLAP